MTFDPDLDRPFRGNMPSASFAEAQMWNFSDGQYGIMYHVGTMPGNLGLWHSALSINCPDGSVLAAKIVGRSEGNMFGSSSVHSKTIDPYKAWQINFDGGMRRFRSEELQRSPGRDGMHTPVSVALDISGTHPVWEPGADSNTHSSKIFETFCDMHHEQPLRVRGHIEIDDTRIEISGVGHRDHSRGPRDFRNLRRGAWFNATFDSGWAFLGFWGEDRAGVQECAAIFEAGRIVRGSMTHNGALQSPTPRPEEFEVIARTEDGRRRTLRVLCTQSTNWFCPGLSEWCVGTDLSHPQNYIWNMAFAEYECDGERGLGFVDRGAAAELLAIA